MKLSVKERLEWTGHEIYIHLVLIWENLLFHKIKINNKMCNWIVLRVKQKRKWD